MKYASAVYAALIAMSCLAFAHQTPGELVVTNPWTRATPNGATVGAGYFTITNKSARNDRLTGGTFEGADHVEIHEIKMNGSVMTMRHLKSGLEIKAGKSVTFSPGSYHLMFIGLNKLLEKDSSAKGVLTFEKAGNIDVEYKVEAIGAIGSSDAGSSGGPAGEEHMHHDAH